MSGDNMKDILTIGEFAKLRNVTTETLRHYDRIGLFKPSKVDSKSGYRYYSILQYEVLGTILELRELGMTTDEIKGYFDNRNLKQSVDILKNKHIDLQKKILELQSLEASIGEKVSHLETLSNVTTFGELVVKTFEEREIFTFNHPIHNRVEIGYACLELESSLEELAPIVASNRYGVIVKEENISLLNPFKTATMFLFKKKEEIIDDAMIIKMPKGKYGCLYYKGSIWELEKNLKHLKELIISNNYRVSGDALQISQIDISVTDNREEGVFEIQMPIK